MRTLSLDRARRIALGAQGFSRPRPTGRIDVRHYRRILDRLGAVQLDSVNVLARAHYLPFFSRLGPYPTDRLDAWLNHGGEAFEYWGHAASLIPMELYPVLRHRMDGFGPGGRVERLAEEHPGYVQQVLEEVARRGPLSVRELSDPGTRRGPWWGHPRGKTALDWLHLKGRLAVHERRTDFTTVYDLPERVIPDEVRSMPDPGPEQARRRLLLRAARALGVATAHELADYFRTPIRAARAHIGALTEEGLLEPVRVEGWSEVAYLHPTTVTPRRITARALISPFDSLIWHRPRTERLFGFHYRIEIYVPEDQRRYGYYVLPFLLEDRLVARVDLKADRGGGRLLVKGAFSEDGHPESRVAAELAAELRLMADWLELGEVVVEDRGDLAGPLRAAG